MVVHVNEIDGPLGQYHRRAPRRGSLRMSALALFAACAILPLILSGCEGGPSEAQQAEIKAKVEEVSTTVQAKAEEAKAAELGKVTEGLNLPPGMKLPF